jgi:hypothetical protein
MTWLTWRQFRVQAIAAAATLAVLAILLGSTGAHVAHLYAVSGLPSCAAHHDCVFRSGNFAAALSGTIYQFVDFLGIGLLYVAPAVIGVFWGAPLITRELEAGTFRLAWSQSVTRTRWLAVKLGLIGLASMAAAGLISLMVTWWSSPINHAAALNGGTNGSASGLNRLTPLMFGAGGVAPVGYAAFAFVLGVTAGVLIRRTVPAMAITLALFALVQLAMPNWVRPHLITPAQSSVAFNASNLTGLSVGNGTVTVTGAVNKPGAWVLSNQTDTAAGHVFHGPVPSACSSDTQSFRACQDALGRLHLRQVVTYQPASRYWALQWYETALFIGLAVVLTGFCFWWIRRRRVA